MRKTILGITLAALLSVPAYALETTSSAAAYQEYLTRERSAPARPGPIEGLTYGPSVPTAEQAKLIREYRLREEAASAGGLAALLGVDIAEGIDASSRAYPIVNPITQPHDGVEAPILQRTQYDGTIYFFVSEDVAREALE